MATCGRHGGSRRCGKSLVRSASHYLERGGVTFFLGDSALRYAAERIFEAYYSVVLRKSVRLTADYQRIANLGYNADRGPVSFYAMRVHLKN